MLQKIVEKLNNLTETERAVLLSMLKTCDTLTAIKHTTKTETYTVAEAILEQSTKTTPEATLTEHIAYTTCRLNDFILSELEPKPQTKNVMVI